MKKSTIGIIAVAVVVVAAVGVYTFTKSGGSSGKTEIEYYSFSANPDYEKQLNEMVADFEKEHKDIKVNVQLAPFDTYLTKIQTLLAGGKAPDVFELNYENFVSYANKGVLMDLSSYVKDDKDIDLDNVNKEAFEAYKLDGKQYGMTESFSNVVTIYNKDMFDAAGVAYPTNEWKWADETAAAEKLTNASKSIWGTYSPVTMNEFYKVAAQNGGAIYDKNGKLDINSEKNVAALQHMVDLVLKDKVSPTPAQLSGQESGDLFVNGQLAMVHTGIWMFESFKKANFNWDIAVEAGNTQKATHFFANGLVVSKDTKKADASYEFVKFMSISKEEAEIRVNNSWELPILTDKTVLKSYLSQTPPSDREVVFESLDYLVMPPVSSIYNKLSTAADAEFQKVLLGDETPKAALDKLQKEFK
ncbi:MAG: sugar ABC transporter substrate-binding protein [Lactobacillaceae bacterium]|jgi:multiple sugar transport system substrate-binding protein|nr:sugar ABC transporter substrate-binding protein [Lactobacillaceae bacterium]